MYNITKLSGISQSFLQTVRTGSREANKVIALGLARAIAYKLPLPSTPVESLISYFDLTCKNIAEEQIAEINEILPLDIPIAKEYVLAVWTVRYRIVFPIGKAYDSVDCPVANFFGFGSAVSLKKLWTWSIKNLRKWILMQMVSLMWLLICLS